MNRQEGFTLLELVIAMAIFALLGLACWRLFDGVVRVERSTTAHEHALRSLQRALAVIERDTLQVNVQPIVLQQTSLQFQRSNWRNPLDQPRSELQNIRYYLDQDTLWRESSSPGQAGVQRQKLLTDVSALSWKLFDRKTGWRHEWPVSRGQSATRPQALEVTLSAGRVEQIRRVVHLPRNGS